MEDNEKRQLQDKIDDYKKAIRTLEESKDEINYQDKIIENIFQICFCNLSMMQNFARVSLNFNNQYGRQRHLKIQNFQK